jgi:cobalt/nickel transport system ATP-binding protein
VLAALLALNPEVIVLDEPMNGLDPKAKRFLRDLLISLHGSGKTIVCSTHDFRYVDGMFSRGVVLSEAHSIARDDAYEAILADPDFLAAHNIL